MKKSIKIFLIVLWSMAWRAHATSYEQYLQAHNAYAQQNYAEAVQLLSSMPQTSFPVLYNLAHAYQRQEQFYDALKACAQALQRAYGAEYKAAYTLYVQLQDELGIPRQHTKYYAYYKYAMAYVPTVCVQLILIILLVLMCIVLWYRVRTGIVNVMLLCTLGAALGAYACYREQTGKHGLIKHARTVLYTGPDYTYGSITELPQGLEFTYRASHGAWYCVAVGKERGWLHETDVDLVP